MNAVFYKGCQLARKRAGVKPARLRAAFCLALLSYICLHSLPASGQIPTSITPAGEENGAVSRSKSNYIHGFTGNWKINHGLSQSPSPVFAKTEVSLVVAQDDQQLTVEQKLRLNGHDQPSQPLHYRLDEKPTDMPVARPVAGKARLTARWLAKEKRLELRSVIETPLHNEKGEKTEDAKLVTIEYWELLEQGKLLKIVRIKEWPDRTETSRLIFERH